MRDHAHFDFQRVSDCGGIRSELVCGKGRPAVWRYANGLALILVVFIVAVLAFWPERLSHILNRVHKPPPSN